MTETRISPLDFQPAQRPKRKRGLPTTSSATSKSFLSPNQFAVLSDSEPEGDEEELTSTPKSSDGKQRIPPIIIYSLLDNHSATLKRVNEKLSTPVDVKSKADRLLLYTKSSADYKTLLSEIQTAKIAYHTYPLPEAVQPRLVLKGIPCNVPEDDIRSDLEAQNIHVTRIVQLTKTDKTTHSIITRYPIFVLTFPPGSDLRKILQLHKLCHCIVKWEKFKNSRQINQCFNCQAFGHSSNFCGKPPRCVKCDQPHATKDCPKPVSSPPKCVNCSGDHPANFTGCPRYLQHLHYAQRANQRHPLTHKPKTPFSHSQNQHSNFPPLRTPPPSIRPKLGLKSQPIPLRIQLITPLAPLSTPSKRFSQCSIFKN